MKNVKLISAIQMFVGLFIQTSALHVFGMNQFVPNLFVAALIPASLIFGPIFGALCGYFGGLVIDLLTGYGLGLAAIPLCIGGFLAGSLKEYLNDKHFFTSALLSIATIVIYDIFMFISLYFSRSVLVINFSLVFQSILVIITTCGFSIINHLLLHIGNDKVSKRRRIRSKY